MWCIAEIQVPKCKAAYLKVSTSSCMSQSFYFNIPQPAKAVHLLMPRNASILRKLMRVTPIQSSTHALSAYFFQELYAVKYCHGTYGMQDANRMEALLFF